MLLMNLTEEENLNKVSWLIDTSFVRFLFVAMFEQDGSITDETAEQCMLFHINSFSATFETYSI